MKQFLLPALCALAALLLLAPESRAQATGNTTTSGTGTTTTGTSTSTSTSSVSGRRRGGAAGDLERRAREIIKKYDKDGDGALNATELAAFFEALHARVEEHREQSGATSASTHHPAGSPQEHAKKAIEKFDKNGDGKLETGELVALLKAIREKAMEHRGGQNPGQVAPATTTPAAPPQS